MRGPRVLRPADGIAFHDATFFGQSVDVLQAVILDDGAGGLEVTHPITEDTMSVAADLNMKAGDTLYVLSLPFGSYTPDQPAADIVVSVSVSGNAHVSQALRIVSSAGFALGKDPLDNPDDDAPIQEATFAASNTNATAITPKLYTVETKFSHPNRDTATGPNHIRSMEITVTVAPEQTLTDAAIDFVLPEQLVFHDATATGGTVAPPPSKTRQAIPPTMSCARPSPRFRGRRSSRSSSM